MGRLTLCHSDLLWAQGTSLAPAPVPPAPPLSKMAALLQKSATFGVATKAVSRRGAVRVQVRTPLPQASTAVWLSMEQFAGICQMESKSGWLVHQEDGHQGTGAAANHCRPDPAPCPHASGLAHA